MLVGLVPTKYLCRVLSCCQAQQYSQELPFSTLAYQHSNIANRFFTAKSANKGKLGTTAIQDVKIKLASSLFSFHFMDSITLGKTVLYQPASISSQTQLSGVHVKQISSTRGSYHSLFYHTALIFQPAKPSRSSSGCFYPAQQGKDATPSEFRPLHLY